tara:strand:- start:113 stop:394 length:282 start_codon:yes stop_codon:yes gene_type:complete
MNNNGITPIGEDRYGNTIYLGDEVILIDYGVPCIMILSRRSTGYKGSYIATPRNEELHAKNYNHWNPDKYHKIVSQERMRNRCIKILKNDKRK